MYLGIFILGLIGAICFLIFGIPIGLVYWLITGPLLNRINKFSFKNCLIVIIGIILMFTFGMAVNVIAIPLALIFGLPVLIVLYYWKKNNKYDSKKEKLK